MAIDKVVDSAVLDGYFEDIADAIRLKSATQTTYTPSDMPTAIMNIPTGGGGGDTLKEAFEGTLESWTYTGSKTTIPDYGLVSFGVKDLTMNGVTTLGEHAFDYNHVIENVSMTQLTEVPDYAFNNATSLKTVNLPSVTRLRSSAFYHTDSFTEIDLPSLEYWAGSGSVFQYCGITIIDTGKNDSSNYTQVANVTKNSNNLTHFVIRRTEVLSLYAVPNTTFRNSPLASGRGYVYVPRALLADYQVATNWSILNANSWRALEDYTVDGTITGALDKTKI